MEPQPDSALPAQASRAPRSFWRNLGAGSLSISLIFHVFLLAGAVAWVLQVISPVEKSITWTSKSGGNESRAAETQVTKQRTQMTRSTSPRVSARDHVSPVLLPEIEDSSPMTSLISPGGDGSLKGIGNLSRGIRATNWKETVGFLPVETIEFSA